MAEKELKHLVRIAKTDLDGRKIVRHALRGIKGISFSFANMTCALADVDKNMKVGYLADDQINRLTEVIENPLSSGVPTWMVNRRRDYNTKEDKHLLIGDIGFYEENDIKRLKKMKSYRGMRHAHGQPVRGQRTRSNFRKNKGKVHLGVQRKKAAAPTEKAGEKKK